MSEDYKYMNTCGHNSIDGACPFGCPESAPLFNVKVKDGGYVKDGDKLVLPVESVEPDPEPKATE